jgi:hypothetical protein
MYTNINSTSPLKHDVMIDGMPALRVAVVSRRFTLRITAPVTMSVRCVFVHRRSCLQLRCSNTSAPVRSQISARSLPQTSI